MIKFITSDQLLSELIFKTTRSSGPGGQNVNKVNSKVILKWDVVHSNILTPEQKEVLLKKAASRLTSDGVLLLNEQGSRSQVQNKEVVMQKLDKLLQIAFTPRKIRKATKPTKASRKKRVQEKKHRAEKKQWRRKNTDD